MKDAAFEWDNATAAENYAKHGVDFETARQVFRDPFAVERIDDREDYGEERLYSHRNGGGRTSDRCPYGTRRPQQVDFRETRHKARTR
jgi:hypothetical protein